LSDIFFDNTDPPCLDLPTKSGPSFRLEIKDWEVFMAFKHLAVVFSLLFSLALAGCGSDNTTELGVQICAPLCVELNFNESHTFTAKVFNATNTTVTWSVLGGDNNGTIDSVSGDYTAPGALPASCIVTVQATSNQDSTRISQASVILPKPGDPTCVCPPPGADPCATP
jgi:hypothetical protein